MKKLSIIIICFMFMISPVLAEEEVTDTSTVNITNLSILYERDYIVLEENNQMQLDISIDPEDANSNDLQWYSLDEDIATIDESGLITAKKYGSVKIGIKNDYINDEFTLNVISEPEKTLNIFIKKFKTIYKSDYFSKKLINSSSFINDLIDTLVTPTITDPRIKYEYVFSRNTSPDSYGYGNYYNLIFSIEDIDGTIYSKTVNNGLYFNTANNIDEEDKLELPDVLTVSLSNTIYYDIGTKLNWMYSQITGRDTIILNIEKVPDKVKQKYRLDLLNGYKVGYQMIYYERKTIIMETTNEITVPYDIRTEADLKYYVKYSGDSATRYLNFNYNQTLTDEYEFDHDNMGIYDFNTNDGRIVPIIIYREERKLTNIDIISPTTRIPLDIYNYELQISESKTPNNASYENVYWKSLNPDVITIDDNRIIKPVSLGNATIKACDNTGNVCGEINIEVVPNDEIYLINSAGYLYLFNDGLLYFLNDKHLELITNNVKKVYADHYLTTDNKLYYVEYVYKDYKPYTYSTHLISESIKEYFITGITNINDELYEYDYINKTIGDKLLDNVKEYNNGLILTNNNELYAYGNNCYSKTLNNGEYISNPILIANNVKSIIKEADVGFYLTIDGNLYAFSTNLAEIALFDTEVSSVEHISTDENDYKFIYKKDNVYKYGSYDITDNIINKNIETINAKKVKYNTITGYSGINTYNIIDENDRYCTPNNCLDNVKDFAILNNSGNDILYLLTKDNKLYYVTPAEYDKFYYLTDNIDSFMFDSIIKTKNNKYWHIFDYGVYPHELYRSTNPYIEIGGIAFNNFMKKDITVGEELDINAIIFPLNATNKNIFWNVDDSSLAEIDSQGKLIAKKSGVVTVYATSENGIVNSIKINIHTKPNTVIIDNKDYSYYIPVDSYYNDYTSHHYIDLYANVGPEDVIDKTLVWTSSNDNLVTIDPWYTEGDYYNHVRIYENGIYSNEEVTIYATLPDGSYSDSITLKLIKNYQSIEYSDITINVKYDYIAKIKIDGITPEDFDTSYISYGYSTPGIFYIDNDNNINVYRKDEIEEGTYPISVYVHNKYYRDFYLNIVNREEPNAYLKSLKVNGNMINDFHSTIFELDLGETESATLDLEAEVFDENSTTIEGTGIINLSYGSQEFIVTVYNRIIDKSENYIFKIKRNIEAPIINIKDLTETINETEAKRIIVNIYENDSNVISKDEIAKLNEKEIKLKINKFDKGLLLYSWDIDLNKFNNNANFDSLMTISMLDNNINDIKIDGMALDFKYKGVLPDNTKLRVYLGNEINNMVLYEFKPNESVQIPYRIYDDYIEFDIDDTNRNIRLINNVFDRGDMNQNKNIDLADIIELLKIYLGIKPSDNLSIIVGDIDYDGKISLSDIINLLKIYLGIN